MASLDAATEGRGPAKASLLYDAKARGIFYQVVVFGALVLFVWWIVGNTIENLQRSNIASGFDFLGRRAGFDIGQTPIEYTSDSTYGRAILVGLLNTLIIAGLGIVTATVIGFLVGLGRLSHNWLIRQICTVYVEVFRNIPPLLVIFFWYFGVLSVLPQPRSSIELPLGTLINNRGIFIPRAEWGAGAWLVAVALLLGIVGSFLVKRWAYQRQMATGQPFPVGKTALGLVIGLPVLAFVVTGFPLSWDFPQVSGFNPRGGMQIKPEFLALFLALSFYTAAFIGEIVRAGVLGVPKGQTEASFALGLRPGQAQRLVIVPQAMRIVIPPLTSQFLNLTKNSSLAIAIGYPDLVSTGGTTLNQTGQAIEIVAIWMAIYLSISLATSLFMNWFNAKMALVER